MSRASLSHSTMRNLLLLFGILAGCSSGDEAAGTFVRNLEDVSEELKVGQELKMDVVNKGEWDQMFLFSPYTPLSEIETAIKLKAPPAIRTARVGERDDINLLVFLSGNNIQVVAAVPRKIVDFSVARDAQPLSRNSAVFKKIGSGNLLAWAGGK